MIKYHHLWSFFSKCSLMISYWFERSRYGYMITIEAANIIVLNKEKKVFFEI